MLGGDAHTPPADGVGHRLHRLVLTHNMSLKPVLQLGQSLELLLLDLAGGDFGPQLDDPGQMGGGEGRVALGLDGGFLPHQLGLAAFQLG